MTLGRFIYLSYHRPKGVVKTCIREGGPIEQWKTERGRREMEAAAWRLPSIVGSRQSSVSVGLEQKARLADSAISRNHSSHVTRLPKGHLAEPRFPSLSSGGKPLEVHVLTGRKFWYQTAFCLWSLAQASGREGRPVIHDDGSLKQEQAEQLQRIFPAARVEWLAEAEEKLDRILPTSRYPALRQRRRELPLMKKILDVHAGRTEWTLFMDADLLFFRRPDFLLEWWDNPRRPLTSVDVEYAYGYPIELLAELARAPVRPLINTGISGHLSNAIDWDKMEFWCRTLIERAGTHYYQEQALIALQTAGQECEVLPSDDYVTLPREPEASHCEAVMHHYVSSSKPWYFRTNWRRIDQGRTKR